MWWFLLAELFGGTPVQWAISVGMFSGMAVGMFLMYRLAFEEARRNRKRGFS